MINFIERSFISYNSYCNSYADAPVEWQIGFQEPATPIMEGIINFHLDIMFYICVICAFVFFIIGRALILFLHKKNEAPRKPVNITHHATLEIVWTLIPVFILASIAVPSLGLLYAIEERSPAEHTVKIIGHQWYWSYEYSDLYKSTETLGFDSYMIPASELKKGTLRLLEVDRRLILPSQTEIRLLVTAADVLHSFAVPSLGVKIDAAPGRLNQVNLFIYRSGVFYGQCSEICGVNHAFMPIVVEVVSPSLFKWWSLNTTA